MPAKVELRVAKDGEETLVYMFERPAAAAEMIAFLSEFWPDAEFVLQPLRH